MIFILSLAGNRFPGGAPTTPMLVADAPDLRFVVSITSVLPSHRPRDSPSHCVIFGDSRGRFPSGMMRASWIISMLRIT